MKNAVIYARFSSHAQNEQSIEGQLAECRAFAEHFDDLHAVDIFYDGVVHDLRRAVITVHLGKAGARHHHDRPHADGQHNKC